MPDFELVTNGDSVDPAPADPTPSPDVVPESGAEADPVPAADPTPTPDTPAVDDLYELPDGRKVDAATLSKEWKENFYPEFTRKSQELSEFKKGGKQDITSPDPNSEEPWKNPDYVPQTYGELVELATKEAIKRLESQKSEVEMRQKQVEDMVTSEINELKKVDPTLDENALFAHANKYGFTNLKTAHQNMTEIKRIETETEKRVLSNLKTREEAPVAGRPTVKVAPPTDEIEWGGHRGESALDTYRRIAGKK